MIITSSQLATTVACGCAATPARRRRSMALISPTRSSWSRLRLSRTIASGAVFSATAGVCSSSTSIAASGAVRSAPSADTIPASMLSPLAFEATGATVDRAAASILVVVDFPLVPVTRTVRRPAASWRISPGSSLSATSPPIIPPDPRPDTREAQVARRDTATAARPRGVRAVGPGVARELMRRV